MGVRTIPFLLPCRSTKGNLFLPQHPSVGGTTCKVVFVLWTSWLKKQSWTPSVPEKTRLDWSDDFLEPPDDMAYGSWTQDSFYASSWQPGPWQFFSKCAQLSYRRSGNRPAFLSLRSAYCCVLAFIPTDSCTMYIVHVQYLKTRIV
jgi:hypothetical protein